MRPDPTTSRYLRLKQIIGDQKALPRLEPLLPISASSWWAGVAEGRFPKPVKLGPNTTAWRWEDIQILLDNFAEGQSNERR
ncbi:MAG: transcriptional regulator [Rhodospirillaceae bacterium]|nr:transcriptional regulator [Rhodospirillaceae bacterium]